MASCLNNVYETNSVLQPVEIVTVLKDTFLNCTRWFTQIIYKPQTFNQTTSLLSGDETPGQLTELASITAGN